MSFAFFYYIRTGNENQLLVGKIYMHYNTSNTISMQNVEPRSNLDPNMYIGFTIDGLNEYKEKDIVYAIDLLYGDVPQGKSEANRIRDDLLKFVVNLKVDDDEKYNMIKQYIDSRYPIFKEIDISEINFNNVWDVLDVYKQKYGDEFILSPLE